MHDLNLGFIGYGRHAKNNLYPSLEVLGIDLRAVATTSETSSSQAKVDLGLANSYSDYREMLASEELDGVLVSAPAEKQLELTLAALESGVNVFVEKPLGMNAEDAAKVIEMQKQTGKFAMVGFMKRYAPAYQKLYQIIADKQFGKLLNVNGMFGVRNFTNSVEDMLIYAAIHYADMLVSVVGEVKEVTSYKQNEGSLIISFSGVATSGATFAMSFIASQAWAKLNEELYVTGTGGYVHVQNVESIKYHFTPERAEKPRWQIMDEIETSVATVSTTSSGGNQQLYQRGFVPELEHFVNCIKEGTTPLTSATENLKTMKLVDMLLG